MDFHSILSELGFTLRDSGTFWQTTAIWRDGDNPTAVLIYKDSGIWKDFVEDTPYLPFTALVKRVTGKENAELAALYKNHKKSKPQPQFLTMEKTYPDSVLKELLPNHFFYTNPTGNRGPIRPEIMNLFESGYATKNKMYQRTVFPIRNEEGRIHGFTGRHTREEGDPKWLNMGEKANWFYPYFNIAACRDAIEDKKEAYIVESVGDCLSLFNAGYENVLVAFTRSLSSKFISRLAFLDCDRFILSFNNDRDKKENRGQTGAAKVLLDLVKFIDLERIYHAIPTKGDFGEMNRADYENFRVSDWKEGIKHMLSFVSEKDKNRKEYRKILGAA